MIKDIAGEMYETPSKEIKEYLMATAVSKPMIPDKNIIMKKYGKLNPTFL